MIIGQNFDFSISVAFLATRNSDLHVVIWASSWFRVLENHFVCYLTA